MNPMDARARYTRMMVENSFLELLRQKPVLKITVTELCQSAQINRATFYKHYQDIPDLLEKMEESIFSRLRTFLEECGYNRYETLTLEMLRYMQREGPRYSALGSDNGDPELAMKTFRLFYESACTILAEKAEGLDREQQEMLYHYLAQGSGGVLGDWFRKGMSLPPETVAEFVLNASIGVVRQILEKNAEKKKVIAGA